LGPVGRRKGREYERNIKAAGRDAEEEKREGVAEKKLWRKPANSADM